MRELFLDVANCQVFLAEMADGVIRRCDIPVPDKLASKIIRGEFHSGINISGQYQTVKYRADLEAFARERGF